MGPGKDSGPLFAIPFGAKDIIETRDLATEYGSPIYRGRIGVEDADIISELQGRGAFLLGKTQTTAFAYITPSPTRNPRNLNHTPGGSSSGSAAAVAARMVPLALGTQTKGSVLRPASYCGVTGFKPTFGSFSMRGVLPFAKSLDTLGFFTNTARDMLSLWHALDRRSAAVELSVLGVPEPMPPVEAPMAAAFQNSIGMLQRAGVSLRYIDIAGMLATLADAAHIVMCYEGARFHRPRYEEHGEKLGDLAAMVRFGLAIAESEYDEARRHIDACRQKVTELYKATPVILVPAATGPAPAGFASTGDPAMNAPWTALGTPAISIPMPVGRALPLGLQLTAAHGEDGLLLRTAVHVAKMLSIQGDRARRRAIVPSAMTAADFRRIALGMEGAVESSHMDHPDFRVNNRIFATLTHDEKLGMVSLSPEAQQGFMREHPSAFSPVNGSWGLQGATRVHLESVEEDALGEAMTFAWRLAVAKGPTKSRAKSPAGKTAKPATATPAKAAASTRTFKDLIAPYSREVQALAKATRTFMLELLPKVQETIDSHGPYIQYSYGPGYKGVVSYITVSQKGVKLGVARGASLPDPKGLLKGAGKAHRHVVIDTPSDLHTPGLRQLVRAAVAAWKKERA